MKTKPPLTKRQRALCETGSTAARKFSLPTQYSKSIDRLAWQLEMSPRKLIERILEVGILTIDNYLSQEVVDPLEPNLVDDFNCTKEMDSMTHDEIADIVEKSGRDCQAVLYARHLVRESKRRQSKEIVTNSIPFFSRPRFSI